MLVTAPYITPQTAQINALFLQPTPWCSRNCHGCYVKGFEQVQNINTSEYDLFAQLIPLINHRDSTIRVNQVTFALDKLPLKPNGVFMDNSHQIPVDKRNKMLYLFGDFLIAKQKSVGGEFHITVHTLRDLYEYCDLNPILLDNIKTLDMISISHLYTIGDLDNLKGLKCDFKNHINWNLTIDPTSNIEVIKENFSIFAEFVDSVYLVLHKPNTGNKFNLDSLTAHQDFIKFIKTQSESIQKKVHIDGCIADSKKYLSTGYGCSSNVSRFQVWPNGSVTGCAYNQNKVTGPARNVEELLNNLVEASKVYEFDNCQIPYHLDPHNKLIKRKNNHYLEIIQ